MVSRYKRHLSLFLVIVLVMSWFVVPEGKVYAATENSVEVAETPYRLTNGYQFSYKIIDSKNIEFSWNQPNVKTKSNTFSRAISTDPSKPYISEYRIQYLVGSPTVMTDENCLNNSWKPLPINRAITDTNLSAKNKTTIKINSEDLNFPLNDPAFYRLQLLKATNGNEITGINVVSCGKNLVSWGNTEVTEDSDSSDETVDASTSSLKKDAVKAAKEMFKSITNDIDKSLSAGTGDVDLIDNKDRAPSVLIRAVRLGLKTDLELTLTNVITSPEKIKARNNNYFLFSINKNKFTPDQKIMFEEAGVDPDILYIAIDMGGNIIVLVDDKSKAGGLFSTGKDRFDTSAKNNLIALGNPDGNNVQTSKNFFKEPLNINLDQYRKIITKRVYNDSLDNGGQIILNDIIDDLFKCKAEPLIVHPNENTTYDAVNPLFPHRIPIGNARKCLNVDSNGWLKTWGVQIDRIDQDPVDDCEKAFGGERGWLSFLTNAAAKSICFILGTIINSATWMAGFSIDFLLKTISLQVR